MSRKVFEYFFDPEDLEPFYSELPIARLRAASSVASEVEPNIVARNDVERGVAENPAEIHRESVSPADATPPSASDNGDSTRIDAAAHTECVEVNTHEHAPQEPHPGGTQLGHEAPRATDSRPQEAVRRTRVRRLLSVHALGQYVFCPRSAILAAEKGDEREVDEPLPRLTYLPNFDLERIEEMLSAKLVQLGFFVVYGVCLVVLMKMGLAEQSRLVFYPSLLGFLGLAFWSLGVLAAIGDLAMRRRAAIAAEAREPAPDIRGTERVNWWSLLKAGFEPVRLQQPLQHPELPLEGAPWRVLQRGSVRIPVVRSGGRELGPKRGRLYAKHEVRLVAYALLLEAAAHVEVPYGVVLPVDSPHGLALAITPELRQRCRHLVAEFDQTLAASQQANIQPALAQQRSRCAGCEYGRPAPTTAKDIENALTDGTQLVVLQQASGELYRCDCADRFGSAPPHRMTVKKGLRVVVN